MKLFWSEPALADIESIRDYIRRDSEFYAGRFINRIIEAVETLVELPARGRLVPEADDPNTRELLFQNYRIMYRLESARIIILAIVHAARDWSQKEVKPWDAT
jgi:plasmid stabilization system protein ParE